jgi:hypothetical protein
LRTKKPLPILATTPNIEIDIHGVEIGAGLGGIALAANEACIEDELFLSAMFENWLDANWTIEIHDLLRKRGNVFQWDFHSTELRNRVIQTMTEVVLKETCL